MSDIDELVLTTHTSDENKLRVAQACLTTLGNQGRIEGEKKTTRGERRKSAQSISLSLVNCLLLKFPFQRVLSDDSCLEISSPAAKQVDKCWGGRLWEASLAVS